MTKTRYVAPAMEQIGSFQALTNGVWWGAFPRHLRSPRTLRDHLVTDEGNVAGLNRSPPHCRRPRCECCRRWIPGPDT